MQELQESISSRELTEWMAFDRIDPIGGQRADILTALVLQMLANINRGANRSAFELDEFIPKWGGGEQKEETEEQFFLRISSMFDRL